jgi:hypothetical protein
MKPIMSIDWLLAIFCTFGNCVFCEYIISDTSVSHFKAEIKSEAKKKQQQLHRVSAEALGDFMC